MRLATSRILLASLLLTLGCASAGDRLEDGIELQAEGRWMEAAYRYADAVDKDASLTEARERLLVAADSAIETALRAAASFWEEGAPVSAADEFRGVDGLLLRIREVGVRIDPPQEYGDLRRESFAWAIDALMIDGVEAMDEGRFSAARTAFRRARSEYEASSEQQAASLDAETDLLIAWGEALLADGRFRAAFDRSAEALELRPSTRPAVAEAVGRIHGEAIALGSRRLAVLPVTSVATVRDAEGDGFGLRLGDDLELDYWREPPPFILVPDPVRVRRETRDATRGGEVLSPRVLRRIVERVEADYAVLVEVASLSAEEQDPEVRSRSVRTHDGRTTSYEVVSGRLTVTASATVVLVDDDGDEIASWTSRASSNGRFERGEYRGDIEELDLGRNEARLFSVEVQDAQRHDAEESVLAELAEEIAGRVFDRILSRIP